MILCLMVHALLHARVPRRSRGTIRHREGDAARAQTVFRPLCHRHDIALSAVSRPARSMHRRSGCPSDCSDLTPSSRDRSRAAGARSTDLRNGVRAPARRRNSSGPRWARAGSQVSCTPDRAARATRSAPPAARRPDRLAHPSLEVRAPDRALFDPEHLEAVVDLVLQVEEFALERAPMPQQKPDAEARCAFDMDVRTTEQQRIVIVRLVPLHLTCACTRRVSGSSIFSSAVEARDAATATCARRVGANPPSPRQRGGASSAVATARFLPHAISHFPLRHFYAAIPAYAAFGIGKPMPSPELCRGAARGARFLLTCRSSARHIIVSPSWSSLRGGNRRPAHTLMLPTRASLRTKAIALLVSTGAAGRKRARLQPCKTMPSRIGRKSVVVRVITSPFGIVRNSAYTLHPAARRPQNGTKLSVAVSSLRRFSCGVRPRSPLKNHRPCRSADPGAASCSVRNLDAKSQL